MSVAFSVVARPHDRLLFAISPSYRQVRTRLEGIGRPLSWKARSQSPMAATNVFWEASIFHWESRF